MIFSGILKLIYYTLLLITSPLRLLQNASLPVEVSNSIAAANSYFLPLDFLVPFGTLFKIFFLILTIEAGIFFYKAIMWAVKKIPGLN